MGLETYRALVRASYTHGRHQPRARATAGSGNQSLFEVGQRDTAAKFALELQKAKTELKQNEDQLALHEQAYENNLKKIQNAGKKLATCGRKFRSTMPTLR